MGLGHGVKPEDRAQHLGRPLRVGRSDQEPAPPGLHDPTDPGPPQRGPDVPGQHP
jgi:hypothetical protein